MKKPVFDIKIESNGPSLEMKVENGEVVMIPFAEA